jgi:hypothetical protein
MDMVRNWQSALASLLLVWVFLDVAVPGVCPLDGSSVATSDATSMQAVPANPSDSGDRPLANDDACFCSCAHLIARAHFALDFSTDSAPVEAQPLFVALDGLPESLYHPPRS